MLSAEGRQYTASSEARNGAVSQISRRDVREKMRDETKRRRGQAQGGANVSSAVDPFILPHLVFCTRATRFRRRLPQLAMRCRALTTSGIRRSPRVNRSAKISCICCLTEIRNIQTTTPQTKNTNVFHVSSFGARWPWQRPPGGAAASSLPVKMGLRPMSSQRMHPTDQTSMDFVYSLASRTTSRDTCFIILVGTVHNCISETLLN